MSAAPWWRRGVVYQIYPRSFLDTDGDGIGDLEGVCRRLDYLAWLGVDALWLSPIFRSPMADFGYDVEDYCDVDPLFGSLAAFDTLLAEAHARGLRVILDWVPNHTSDRHPWFRDARTARTSAKRHWYVWRDPRPDGGPPNNWTAAFPPDTPAWTFDPATAQYYLHLFLSQQPDLDWRHPEVVEAMHAVLRFWLDRGVDGFRVDVVHALGKDPALPDEPLHLAGIPHAALNDRPETHAFLRVLRRLVDAYPGDRMLVGEIWLLLARTYAQYYGTADELHLVFDLPAAVTTPWSAAAWQTRVQEVEAAHGTESWPAWVLSNHDGMRHRSRFGSEARARAAAVLLLTLRGTPFLYAGEELGLEDAEIPPGRRRDPGGRDGCRAPIPWEPGSGHGWPVAEPWLPWPPEAETRNVDTQQTDTGSILHLYRRLLILRRRSVALALGRLALRDGPEGTLMHERSAPGGERCLVIVNFTDAPIEVAARGTIVLASDGPGEGTAFSGTLAPAQAVVLVED